MKLNPRQRHRVCASSASLPLVLVGTTTIPCIVRPTLFSIRACEGHPTSTVFFPTEHRPNQPPPTPIPSVSPAPVCLVAPSPTCGDGWIRSVPVAAGHLALLGRGRRVRHRAGVEGQPAQALREPLGLPEAQGRCRAPPALVEACTERLATAVYAGKYAEKQGSRAGSGPASLSTPQYRLG